MRELTYFDVVALIDDLREENANLTARIAELEEQVWSLNLENERMEEAYWIDESIAPDGTSKPSVRKLLERLEKAETDLRLSDDLVKALDNRIAELEAESERFTVHSDIERQDAEERAHLEKLVPDLKKRIAELEGLAQKLVWVGNDLLTDNTNPVTIVLFSGLAFRSKELLP